MLKQGVEGKTRLQVMYSSFVFFLIIDKQNDVEI